METHSDAESGELIALQVERCSLSIERTAAHRLEINIETGGHDASIVIAKRARRPGIELRMPEPLPHAMSAQKAEPDGAIRSIRAIDASVEIGRPDHRTIRVSVSSPEEGVGWAAEVRIRTEDTTGLRMKLADEREAKP